MAVVTPQIVEQVALLARLRLEGEALSATVAQLDRILEYVKRLQAIPTEGVEPTSHVLPLSNVMRADAPQPSLAQEAVCRMSPSAQPPFFKVPKVIEG
jgi:aspartyl-tRNA(Asn)/glutamyl-tRNA(Gln) amidotransferase subunit C